MVWEPDQNISRRISYLSSKLGITWIKNKRIYTFKSYNSTSRAVARIWGLPKVWQQALGEEPAYVVEVISEKYDNLSEREQDRVLIHELAHIPMNFSGALLPHTRKRKGSFHDKLKGYINEYDRK